MNLNELRDKAYNISYEHGFHDKELSNEHCLMLVITELSEAVEADRKGRRAKTDSFKSWQYKFSCHTEEGKIRSFKEDFEAYIKDTIEDELADAVIRLLDLYGLRGIDLDEDAIVEETITEYCKTYKNKSFTEAIFYIVQFIGNISRDIKISAVLPEMTILEIFGLAKNLGIDLIWHIEQKMKYNSLRENMHGKKY